jgi:hypothetical protein
MIDLLLSVKGFCPRRVLLVLALFGCFSNAALGANYITGSVRNQSRGEAAAGDEVVLVRLDKGMHEEARAKTDALGAFTLGVQHPDRPYLVRVVHQGVSYDRQASAGQALSIEVFDAAAHVRGITGAIEILRTGTNGKLLHVSDLIEIKNVSSPPLTQAGERAFEVYLPANARIDSVLAAGPGETGMVISAASVAGQPGHYKVNFPLRPGATKFAFNYDLPYGGHAEFRMRHAYPLQQMAVMIPPTMKFSSRSPAFKVLPAGNSRFQVLAANQVQAGEEPAFEVSGIGVLPPVGNQADAQARSQSPGVPGRMVSAPGRAALPSLASIDSRWKQTQPPSQSLVLSAVTFALLTACALLIWRARKVPRISAAQVAARTRQKQSSTS